MDDNDIQVIPEENQHTVVIPPGKKLRKICLTCKFSKVPTDKISICMSDQFRIWRKLDPDVEIRITQYDSCKFWEQSERIINPWDNKDGKKKGMV